MMDQEQVTLEGFLQFFDSVPNTCPLCNSIIKSFGWCQMCESLKFKNKFPNWTTGHESLDKIIQWSQENSYQNCDCLECINYDDLTEVNLVRELEYTMIYKATWREGPLLNWDLKSKKWTRGEANVILKRFKNSQIISARYLTQVNCDFLGSAIRHPFLVTLLLFFFVSYPRFSGTSNV